MERADSAQIMPPWVRRGCMWLGWSRNQIRSHSSRNWAQVFGRENQLLGAPRRIGGIDRNKTTGVGRQSSCGQDGQNHLRMLRLLPKARSRAARPAAERGKVSI